MKLSLIKSNPNNPRVIKDEKFQKLVKSINEFPKMMELRPMVINDDMVVLGGNMRLKALKELNYKDIPDNWVKKASDLTEEEQRRFIIADNVGFGDHDWDVLRAEWDLSELEDWGMDIPQFETEAPEAEEDNFEGDLPKEPISVPGDLYELGQHRVHCASSTDSDAVAKLMDGKLFDLVVTDPPYNVAYEGKTKDALTIQNDSMGDSDFYQFLLDFYTTFGLFTKAGGAWYVWFADVEIVNFAKAFKDAGIKLAQMIIWHKNTMVMGRKDYHFKHEPCLYGWKEGAAHGWYSDRKQTTVLNFDKPTRNDVHPTMKPIPLIAYQITNSSKQGDIIGDGFLGSGTTLIASDQLGRTCYGQELDPKYVDVIVARYINHKLQSGATASSLVIKRNGKQLSDKEVNAFIENTNGKQKA